jgi:hypothetical protein
LFYFFKTNDAEWSTLFIITACGHVISALAFLLFGTSAGGDQLHVVDSNSMLPSQAHAIEEPLGDHEADCPDLAVAEHQMSPVDDEDEDIDAAAMTSASASDDPRWRLQSGSYYNSVSSPTSGAPTYFSSADNSETESMNNVGGDELDDIVTGARDRGRTNDKEHRGWQIGRKTCNGSTALVMRSPAGGAVVGVEQLSESVL